MFALFNCRVSWLSVPQWSHAARLLAAAACVVAGLLAAGCDTIAGDDVEHNASLPNGDEAETAADFGHIEGRLGSTYPSKKLAFSQSDTRTLQAGLAVVWQFDAAQGDQFALTLNNWKKAVMTVQLQRRLASGLWQSIQTTAAASKLTVGATPTSTGTYRAVVTTLKSGIGVTAYLSCVKGACTPNPCPAKTAAASLAKQQVDSAVAPLLNGKTWISESDYGFDAVGLAGVGSATPTPSELAYLLQMPQGIHTEVWSADKFWAAWLEQGQDPKLVAQIRSKLEALGAHWTVVRLGKVQIQLYIVGRTPCGAIVGLHTVSVET